MRVNLRYALLTDSHNGRVLVRGFLKEQVSFVTCTCILFVHISNIIIPVWLLQINGVSIFQVPARDVYSFGLTLLDMLFSREELGKSLLLPTSKSSKPGLDKDRVDKLFGK